jgi:hypothetical protein
LTTLLIFPAAAGEGTIRRSPSAIPGSYIVGLKDLDGRNVAAHAATLANAHGGRVTSVYDAVLSGFAIEMTEEAAKALARNPMVRFVEEDAEGWISSLSAKDITSDDEGQWHRDRSDQRQVDAGGLDGIYGYCSTGQGVYAYIVDTGIWKDHEEVKGRVLTGVNASNSTDGSANNPCVSDRPGQPKGGHGTAVASVLAGKNIGIAKGATLVPVRTHRCDGTTSTRMVLDGLEWINSAENPSRDPDNPALPRRGVVNMSFWFPPASNQDELEAEAALPGAIGDLEAAGFAVFVSANNYPEESACNRQPASFARSVGGKVVTVGGTMLLGPNLDRDFRWHTGTGQDQGSSFGACVDIWAPAQTIRVADYSTATGSKISSGTSYSAPLVAGIAARFLQDDPSWTPYQLWEGRLKHYATKTDTTGLSLIREPPGSGRTAGETTPNNLMVFLKDHVDGNCRLRPVRLVSITKQPSSWTLPSGSQVTLTVETNEPADFQWYRGVSGDMTQPVWGEMSASFTIPPLASTTSYCVRVDGEINAVVSDTATITIGSCPGISGWVSPSSTTILQGESVTLSVSASSTNPLTYEWKASGSQGWTAIPDSNKTSITVSPNEFTRYAAVMNNGCRTVASSLAEVFVSREYTVALATYYWNFVGAEGGGGYGVHATATAPSAWERLILRDLNGSDLVDGDQVTLRSHSGHYVVAEWCGGPGQTVNANRTAAGDWETFEIRNMDGGYWIGHGSNIALKACRGSGYYVVAEFGGLNGGGPGAGEVNCDREQAGAWETFQLLWQ